jgi:hypothetical protein
MPNETDLVKALEGALGLPAGEAKKIAVTVTSPGGRQCVYIAVVGVAEIPSFDQAEAPADDKAAQDGIAGRWLESLMSLGLHFSRLVAVRGENGEFGPVLIRDLARLPVGTVVKFDSGSVGRIEEPVTDARGTRWLAVSQVG